MVGGASSKGKNHSEKHIVLSIKSQDGDSCYYRVAKERKIESLLSTYCKAKNLKIGDVVFLYDGAYLQTTKTLLELGMKDGDQIDAMVHQHGG